MEVNQKVLVFSPVATHPPHRGNRQRILQMATLFKDSGYAVDLAIGRNRTITPEAEDFWSDIHVLKRAPRWRPTAGKVPFDTWYTPGLGEEFADVVRKSGASFVLFNYIFHSKAMEYLPPGVFSILDTHDVFTDRSSLHKSRKYSGGFFSCTPEDEKKYLDRANAIVAISGEDATHFGKMLADKPLFTIPYVKNPRPEPQEAPDNSRSITTRVPTFGVVMSANDLNLASLYQLIQDVDSHWGANPPFRLKIAGDINNIAFKFLPHRRSRFLKKWLEYVGSQDDLSSFYNQVDACINPVIEGTGMAVKFSEPLALGVPVLSTARGSRGFDTTHELHKLGHVSELARAMGSWSDSQRADLVAAGYACLEAAETFLSGEREKLMSWIKGKKPSHTSREEATSS